MDDALHRRFLETGSEEALSLLMEKHYKAIRAHVFRIVENAKMPMKSPMKLSAKPSIREKRLSILRDSWDGYIPQRKMRQLTG